MKTFEECINDLTPGEVAELIKSAEPTKLQRYRQAITTAAADPGDNDKILQVMLLYTKIFK